MKTQLFQRFVAALLLTLLPLGKMLAYDFSSNGIYYLITSSTTVSVTYGTSTYGTYSGELNIPSTVSYGGQNYTVTGITASACHSCSYLTSVSIPKTITSVGSSAFVSCTGLDRVYITDVAAWCRISWYDAYYSNPLCYAKNLYVNNTLAKSITVPSGVTTIGRYLFNCPSLENITIPASVTRIEARAFDRCSKLDRVVLEDGTASLTLGILETGGRYTEYDYGVFHNCNLSYMYVGRNLVCEERPFEWWDDGEYLKSGSVEQIEFGKNVTSIHQLLLPRSGIESIIFNAAPSACTATIPSEVSSVCTLVVPKDQYAKYQATAPWSSFSNITYMSDDNLALDNAEIKKGRVNLVPVAMNNVSSIVSFNCDVELPQGLSLARDAYGDYDLALGIRCDNTHIIAASDLDGKIRVVEYSSKNRPITGNDGTLFYLPVVVDDSVEPETKLAIKISNICLTKDGTFEEITCPDARAYMTILPPYTLGDVNNDGKYSAADVSLAVEFALGRTPASGIAEAADVNEDGKVSAADLSIIVSYILDGKTINNGISKVAGRTARDGKMNLDAQNESYVSTFLSAESPYAFTASNVEGEKGAVVELPIGMNNGDVATTSFQFDLYLPDGISIETDSYGDYVAELSSRAAGHAIETAQQADGAIRFLSYSGKNRTYSGSDGVIVTTTLKLDAEPGEYTIRIKKASITQAGTFDEFDCAETTITLTVLGDAPTSIDLVDGTPYSNSREMTDMTVTYTRNFINNGWQALYVPFDMAYEDWADKADVAYINNVHQWDDDKDGEIDRTVLEFITKTSGSIKANTPYVIKPKNTGVATFTASNTTLYAAPETDGYVDCRSTTTEYTLYGTYREKTDMYSNGYYGMSDGNFMQASSDAVTLSPYRIYLKIEDRWGNGSAHKLPGRVGVMVDGVIDDNATFIQAVNTEDSHGTDVFNLAGQKVASNYKGIVVKDGKKVLVK